jgi:lysophospholipase L1-like esterase
MRQFRLRGDVAALALVAAAGACGGSDENDAASPSTTAETATSASVPHTTTVAVSPGSRYVALGSSFAAGTNVPTQGPTCGRSDHNYPSLVAAALQLELVDVSCGAATTANLIDQPQGESPPQIDALDAETQLVTVTAGGNDIQYSATALECGTDAEGCLSTLDTAAIDAAVADLPGRLEELALAIRERAPDATVVLVTYPQVVPPEGAECTALGLHAEGAAYLGELGQRLDDAFHAAAEAADLVLVDAYGASVGHGPCAADADRWMSGADGGTDSFAFHPTATGHEAMADLVVEALTNAD